MTEEETKEKRTLTAEDHALRAKKALDAQATVSVTQDSAGQDNASQKKRNNKSQDA